MANVPDLVKAIGNKINTVLASGINNSTLTITVSSGTGLNATGGAIIIDKGLATEEIVYIESVSGTTLTVATNGRGYAGTSAQSHSSGAPVNDVVIKEHVNNLVSEVGDFQSDLSTVTSNLNTLTNNLALVFSGYQNSGQTVSTNTVTTVNIDTEITDGGADFSSNTYTAPVTGKYFVDAQVEYTNPGTNTSIQALIIKNLSGGGTNAKLNKSFANTTGNQTVHISGVVVLTVNDTLTLRAYHEKGSNTLLGTGAANTYLDIFFIST